RLPQPSYSEIMKPACHRRKGRTKEQRTSSSIFAGMEIQDRIAEARSVRGIPFDQLVLPYSSLGEMLLLRSEESPEKTWLTFYDEDGSRTEFSYREFTRLVQRIAGFLRQAGIDIGDRVATLGHNHSDTVLQY